MAKRAATNQLTHDNWEDEDDEVEEQGHCPIASSVALQNRVIRKARRSREPSDEETVKSPFMGFSGFAKASPQPFMWNSPADTMSDVFRKRKQNGCGETEKPKSASELNSDVTTAKKMCISKESKIESKDLDHFRHLQKLNESVLDWMQKHMAKNPYCDFTPVFNDYKNHLSTLERKYPVQKQSASASSIAKNNDTPFKMPGLIAAKSSSLLADSSADSIAKSGFSKFMKNNDSMESKDDSDREMDYGAGFTSNTTNTSTISFGIKGRALTETSSGSPMGPSISHSSGKKGEGEDDETADKKAEVEKEKSTPTFKFGFKSNFGSSPFEKLQSKATEPFRFSSGVTDSKTFSFGIGASTSSTAADKTKEDEEYVPPKNEVSAVVEKDALYSKRCKLFFKKDDNFADKGVGTLYLKSLDGKTQLLVRADTNLGNILLNIRLSSTIPVQRTGKNNVLIVCVPNPCIDPKNPDSKEAIPMLIRVKTASDADELFEALNKHKS